MANGHKAMLTNSSNACAASTPITTTSISPWPCWRRPPPRYDFEDARDEKQLAAKYNRACKYYQMAYTWADTEKGKASILAPADGISELRDPALSPILTGPC